MQHPLTVQSFMAAAGPLLDVRTPSEFERGHIPGSENLPLFSDAERAEVGTLYSQQGSQPAVIRGLEQVGPRLAPLAEQLVYKARLGTLRILCWRGGMRSGSVAWLAETLALPVLRLEGGYKSFRRWVLESFAQPWPLRLLGGPTGCGKTEVLQALQRFGGAMVNLEAIANHRGSSFGGLGQQPQPTVEHFENLLAMALNQLRGSSPIWLEAESAQVGRCRIPADFWKQMQRAPLVLLERPLQQRIAHLVEIYGQQAPQGLLDATERLARKLGPQRTQTATELIKAGNLEAASAVILEYYDRTYAHGLRRDSAPLASIWAEEMDAEQVARLLLTQHSA
jgi:tRNA 2-selenouridine synthase